MLPRTAGERTSLVVRGVKIKMSGMIYIQRSNRKIRKVEQESGSEKRSPLKG